MAAATTDGRGIMMGQAAERAGSIDRASIDTVVFDLGGVLVDWNPRYAYRPLFDGDEEAMERFLAEICTSAWNHQLDEGRPFAEAIAELSARHPDQAHLIRAWWDRWPDMLGGVIPETVALLEALHRDGVPLYAITNWSGETFPIARGRFEFLKLFRDIVVSGDERLAKPDRRIFDLLVARAGIDPRRSVFIDDAPKNVAAAEALGFAAVHFTGAEDLARRLRAYGFLGGLPGVAP
ncbi:HAD family hydrolase [Arenibaculum pallidiluteum]|uniref:HAD family hydrolase n=1 Tax=Arenibaculum pallidiluteum TaxID=2812559 RepID=UPI001F472B57|nr:HAD family phosphatase [Arenibaculum pallidiluteum]